jgi:hypothetical protein
MISPIAPADRGKFEETDEISIYKKLYRQAQELIEELQEQLALSKSLIGRHEELAKVQQLRVKELEEQLAATNDRLKSEQERSAKFRLALKRFQESQETKSDATPEVPVSSAPVIESWAVKEVASVPPISTPTPIVNEAPEQGATPVPINQKRGLESLAAVKLPQFPPLRRR